MVVTPSQGLKALLISIIVIPTAYGMNIWRPIAQKWAKPVFTSPSYKNQFRTIATKGKKPGCSWYTKAGLACGFTGLGFVAAKQKFELYKTKKKLRFTERMLNGIDAAYEKLEAQYIALEKRLKN